jgi:hypothetical protein
MIAAAAIVGQRAARARAQREHRGTCDQSCLLQHESLSSWCGSTPRVWGKSAFQNYNFNDVA